MRFRDDSGFTLIELMVVMTVISIFMVVTIPRASRALRSDSSNEKIFRTMVEKTSTDAIINRRTDFLIVHLIKDDSSSEEYSSRENGLSVYTFSDEGLLVESTNPQLKFRQFPSSYSFQTVTAGRGVTFDAGDVLIPFYPDGKSEEAIVSIESNNSRKNFKISSLTGKLTELNEETNSVYITE